MFKWSNNLTKKIGIVALAATMVLPFYSNFMPAAKAASSPNTGTTIGDVYLPIAPVPGEMQDAGFTKYNFLTGATSASTFGMLESYAPVVSPDGKHLAFGYNRNDGAYLAIYNKDTNTKKDIALSIFENYTVFDSIVFTKDGSKVAVVRHAGSALKSYMASLIVIDPVTGNLTKPQDDLNLLDNHSSPYARAVIINVNGSEKLLVALANDNAFIQYGINSNGKLELETATHLSRSRDVSGNYHHIQQFILSPDGKKLYGNLSNTREVVVWDIDTKLSTVHSVAFDGTIPNNFSAASNNSYGMALSPDGTELYVTNSTEAGTPSVTVFDTATFTKQRAKTNFDTSVFGGRIANVGVSPSGKEIIVENTNSDFTKKTYAILDAATFDTLKTFDRPPGDRIFNGFYYSQLSFPSYYTGSLSLSSITVSPATLNITDDQEHALAVSANLSANYAPVLGNAVVTFTSNDTSVATVSAAGKVSGVAPGTTTINVAYGNRTASVAVTVSMPPTAIELTAGSAAIEYGSTTQLSVAGKNGSTSIGSLTSEATYASSNTAVATVSPTGLVTAIGVGTTTITATYGTFTDSITITVSTVLNSISAEVTPTTVFVGDTAQIDTTGHYSDNTTAAIDPAQLTYFSHDPAVATVNAQGVVQAVYAGTVSINVYKQPLQTSVAITVKNSQLLRLESDAANVALAVGQTHATIIQAVYEHKTIPYALPLKYVSSDTSIASVDANGVITGVAEGSVAITVSLPDDTMPIQIDVNVDLPVNTLAADVSARTIDAGTSFTPSFTATVTVGGSEQTIAPTTGIVFTSSAPAIATVDSNGAIQALREGIVTITATFRGVSTTIRVTVKPVLTSISLDKTRYEVDANDKVNFVVKGQYVGADEKVIDTTKAPIVTIADENIASLMAYMHRFHAYRAGTTTITVEYEGKTAQADIVVNKYLNSIRSLTHASMFAGGTLTLEVTANYTDASEEPVTNATFSTSNTAVAAVSESGVVTAVAPGSAVVTIQALGKTITVPITVIASNGGGSTPGDGGGSTPGDGGGSTPGDGGGSTPGDGGGSTPSDGGGSTPGDGGGSTPGDGGGSTPGNGGGSGTTTGGNTGTAPNAEAQFSDVANHWASTTINRAIDLGLVSGFDDGSFRPNEEVTRGQLAVLLTRALKLDSNGQGTTSFSDESRIPGWAADAIKAVTEAGLMNGYEDGSFNSSRPASRVEIAVIIARALGVKSTNPIQASDASTIPAWATPEVAALIELGIIQGRADGSFDPNRTATRAESITMLLRMIEYMEAQDNQ